MLKMTSTNLCSALSHRFLSLDYIKVLLLKSFIMKETITIVNYADIVIASYIMTLLNNRTFNLSRFKIYNSRNYTKSLKSLQTHEY